MFMTTDSIIYNGRNSLLDFGLTIASKEFIEPEIKEIRDTVPYMDGDYDFTMISGKPHYGNRQIIVVFNIEAENYGTLFQKRTEIVKWLLSKRGGELKFDYIKGWQFENVSAQMGGFVRKSFNCAELTVTFTAAPYLSNGKQNITLIPTCPRFTGNTFGYIYKSGGGLKVTTTDNVCESVQKTTNSGSEKVITDITFTADTPSEIVFALYTSPKVWRSVFAVDVNGNNVGEIPPECEDTYGNTVYRWSAEKYPAAGVRFVANATEYRGVKVLYAGIAVNAPNAPIRCKYNGDDIQFRINGKNLTYETALAEGGNIIAQPYSSAEVYAALRKEAL